MAEQKAYNIDCMEYMKTIPDKYFDLAVVDPPYGGGADTDGTGLRFHGGDIWNKYDLEKLDKKSNVTESDELGTHFHGRGRSKKYAEVLDKSVGRTGGTWASKYGKSILNWDIAPPPEYFQELFRVSKNQIIWGGNYFSLPPTRCFLIWKKLTISEQFSMAMAEYAWTSFNANAKIFECAPQGKKGDERFHPTQKPIELYKWIYENYTEHDFKILDTHLGSGSSRLAAYDYDLDFVGCEINETYFKLQEKRFDDYSSQTRFI